MNFQSLVRGACAVLASLVLASCGGGGAKTDPNRGGDLSIQPANGTFYAGVPSRLTLSGGRTPYSLTSSEPTVLDVPNITSAHFIDVTPNNPGTIDQGLPADALPVRTVVITLRDSQGLQQTANIKVAHNFLTGYSIVFTPSICPAGANACAGGETVVQFDTVTNGVRIGDRPFIVSMVAGQCLFENPPGANPPGSGPLATSFATASDHQGKVTAVIFCPAGVTPSVGMLRLIDVGTGASTTATFTITGVSAGGTTMEVIPNKFDFTGPDSATCGTGQGDFFVFGGAPPYTVASSDASITATAVQADKNPGHFTVNANNSLKCVDATLIVADNAGRHASVEVKTEAGSAPPATPATPLVLTPSSLILGCGTSGSVLVTGGSGGALSTATADPNLTVTTGTNTVTVSRAGANPPLAPNVNSTVSITDGTSVVTLTVNNPGSCS